MSAMGVGSRLSTLRCKLKSVSSFSNFFKSSSPPQPSASARRIPRTSRLPVEGSCCLIAMLPLHSAIASARLQSLLSVDSQSWCLVPQGISMPL